MMNNSWHKSEMIESIDFDINKTWLFLDNTFILVY